MVKPRGKVTYGGFQAAPRDTIEVEIDEIKIAAWCPDDLAQEPPEQVHFIFRLRDLDATFVIRYKGPDTLGFLIEELARYRREVWPDAKPTK